MSRLGAYESEFWLFQTFFEPRKEKIDEIVLPPCVQTAISRKPFRLQSWDWSQCFQNLILHPTWTFRKVGKLILTIFRPFFVTGGSEPNWENSEI